MSETAHKWSITEDPERIELAPQCYDDSVEGRCWGPVGVFEACGGDCPCEPVPYIRVDLHERQLAAKDAEISTLQKATQKGAERLLTLQGDYASKMVEIANLKESLRISRQAKKYSRDVAAQADAARREVERQLESANILIAQLKHRIEEISEIHGGPQIANCIVVNRKEAHKLALTQVREWLKNVWPEALERFDQNFSVNR